MNAPRRLFSKSRRRSALRVGEAGPGLQEAMICRGTSGSCGRLFQKIKRRSMTRLDGPPPPRLGELQPIPSFSISGAGGQRCYPPNLTPRRASRLRIKARRLSKGRRALSFQCLDRLQVSKRPTVLSGPRPGQALGSSFVGTPKSAIGSAAERDPSEEAAVRVVGDSQCGSRTLRQPNGDGETESGPAAGVP